MSTVRCTTAEAVVRFLVAQKTMIDGEKVQLFPGVYGIFGHGNVTSLALALREVRDVMPTWRGQNEQGMALAAVAFAKASKRKRIMVATSSVGPGATNMVTAAGVAMSNRLPVLLLSGDTFSSRLPDPVLQQVEHFGDPTITVNDAFKPVVRYWDRITSPEQIVASLPQAVRTMLDPATCGPAFIGLPQDVQAEAWDYPTEFFDEVVHEIARPRADVGQLQRAATAIRDAKRPLLIAGGGVHYSDAEETLRRFAENLNIPVVETVAGKACLTADHPLNCGPIGTTGCTSANALAAEADVVIAVGSRLQDFTTASWTAFAADARFVGVNAAGFDAAKHRALPVVGDAKAALEELLSLLEGVRFSDDWTDRASVETAQYHAYIDKIAAKTSSESGRTTYAQVVGAVDRASVPSDYAVGAAGGLPGELNNGWRSKGVHTFDVEYGFSCMGYEISGAWGAKMALPDREVITFVGDGSYLMMNSDLYSSVLSGHKLIVVVCDNEGYAVINRLQVNQGGEPFNNLLRDTRHAEYVRVDFAAHARSLGCEVERVESIDQFEAAFARARANVRTSVIVIDVDQDSWTEGGGGWVVGVPETSDRPQVRAAREALVEGKRRQRRGV
ncbi:MAG: 3D-(3,5/4)-trihydroxycyclohexane-1,2-dione acylhydrolase (decyclizing) [Ilumatobacteraceae bacterium]